MEAGHGRTRGQIGSLLLGIPGDDGLQYVGKVGTGFTQRTLADLSSVGAARAQDQPIRRRPPRVERDARWVTPKIVGEVAVRRMDA